MVHHDQPTIFPPDVRVGVSSVEDGTMTLRSLPEHPEQVWHNRQEFIAKCGGELAKTALVYVTYDDDRDFETYKLARDVQSGVVAISQSVADAVATDKESVGVFLPIGDCCAVTLYDPVHRALMVSHIGRHSVEVYGGRKSVVYMNRNFGTDPRDILAWLSPSVGEQNYPITKRGDRGLKQLIADDLLDAGVEQGQIEISPVDTSTDDRYFSHSEFKKGNRDLDGRFAVFAQMTS